ncbi:hypothetical protein LDY75_13415, partial [Klebsiella pneumoniae]|nr:hypothetical protein [Klebsiella pneumoniae]
VPGRQGGKSEKAAAGADKGKQQPAARQGIVQRIRQNKAERHQIANPGYAHKSLYYLGGLTEGSETILLFVLGCLFPAHFAWLAWLFGALCWLTTATRICSGYQTLKRVTTTA